MAYSLRKKPSRAHRCQTTANPKADEPTGELAYLVISSGGSRNLERGVQLRVHEAQPKIFGLPRPLPDVNARVIIVTTDR